MKKLLSIFIILASFGTIYYLTNTFNIDVVIKINNNDLSTQVISSNIYKESDNQNKETNNTKENEIIIENDNYDIIDENKKTKNYYIDDIKVSSRKENIVNNKRTVKENKEENLDSELTSSNDLQVAFSEETIKKFQESISAEDKAKLMKLVLPKLSLSDINFLKGFLTGGITEEEKNEAIKFAEERFSKEELDEFIKIYQKYSN